MPDSPETYARRNGKKVVLTKSPDEFVVRATPEELHNIGIVDAERVSPYSSRVKTRSIELEPQMKP